MGIGGLTTTGSSEAIRFDKALFRQHPEFRQKAGVVAHVIGPGTLLVRLTEDGPPADERDVPMVARAVDLTRHVVVTDDDTIPDDVTF